VTDICKFKSLLTKCKRSVTSSKYCDRHAHWGNGSSDKDRKILVREIDYDDTDYLLLHPSDKIIATHAMKYDDGTKFYIIIEEASND